MNWKEIFVKGLRSACPYLKSNSICKENTIFFQNLKTMGPTKKKTQLMPEESEIIIDIDRKGACTFKIISKVESISEKNTNIPKTDSATKEVPVLSILSNGLNEHASKFDENCKTSGRKHKKSSLINTLAMTIQSQNRCVHTRKHCDKYPPTSRFVALDCEFVGVGNDISALGRCSIVDYEGKVICDIYAKPLEKITTYRTRWSGITKQHMAKAIPLESALSQISDIIKDKIVVGHALRNDFLVLGFSHPPELIRDTGTCPPLARLMRQAGSGVSKQMSLKKVAWTLLGRKIQVGCHCSVIDAQTCMELYRLVRDEWEERIIEQRDNGGGAGGNDGSDNSTDIKPNVDQPTEGNVDDRVEEGSSSVDKLNVCRASHDDLTNDVTKNDGLERNHLKMSVRQKRKISNSETLSNEANSGLSEVLKMKCLTDSNCTMSHSSDSGLSSDCSDSIHGESSAGSTSSVLNNVFSQNHQTCDTSAVAVSTNSGPQLKKHKSGGVRKSKLAAEYTKNVKHLFHDLFWEDLDNLFQDANCDMN